MSNEQVHIEQVRIEYYFIIIIFIIIINENNGEIKLELSFW